MTLPMQPELPLTLPLAFDVCAFCFSLVLEPYLLRHEAYHRDVQGLRLSPPPEFED